MNDSKEFLGKTLDAAIAEACAYYDVPREKLEIDIIEDAKTGIFGIVGARKAKIHARLATLPDFMMLSMPRPEREGRGRGKRRRDKAEVEGVMCNIHSIGARDFSPSYGLATRAFMGLKSHAPIYFCCRFKFRFIGHR